MLSRWPWQAAAIEEKCAHLVDSLGDFLGMKAQNWGENEGEKRVSKYTVNKLVEFHVHLFKTFCRGNELLTWHEHIYNPITTMGFSAMFTFQLDNTKR